MKIEYAPNPLATKIILDDHDKEIFRLKIKINELMEDIGSASIYLDPKNANWVMSTSNRRPQGHTLETLIEEVREDYLDMEYMYGEGDPARSLDKRVEDLLTHYVEELEGSHLGDCTCFAMSCSKCFAENILGVDTIEGLGKHSAYRIERAFSRWNPTTKKHDGPIVSLDEALEKLQHFDPKPPEDMTVWDKVGGWAKHLPRWKTEANAAYDWLLSYKKKHFPS